jgi:uncharacterized protein (DUF362 family)
VKERLSRRKFLNIIGKGTTGLFLTPFLKSSGIKAFADQLDPPYLAQVAITPADNYEWTYIKQKVQYLFETLGGIGDIVKSGNKVAIKINLTGGSGSIDYDKLNGVSVQESYWTHPEVLRAVGELLIDCGVKGNDIYIVESLWDPASFNDFGYQEVQQSLGAQLVNLNDPAPYSAFIDKAIGDKKFYYSSFKMNQILSDIDVYVSIPKMKQHYNAGVTHSIKNQIGIVPLQYYTQSGKSGYRSALHYDGGNINTHLPRSICDLFLARPVNLAIIDGIKNAEGGEGPWTSTFRTAAYNVLLAGKEAVATDSIASFLMGNDPAAAKLQLPDGHQCDNYLELLHQKGLGTNQLSEIEILGDGTRLVNAVIPEYKHIVPQNYQLFQNFPNPFNSSTAIKFYLPRAENVTIKIYDLSGQELETLIKSSFPAGQHKLYWSPKNLPSGIYFYRMQTGQFSASRKMIYAK